MKKLATVLATLLLAACGASSSTPDGTYLEAKHVGFTFTPDGKVTSAGLQGPAKTTTYHVDGKVVTFAFPGGLPAQFTINDNGTLSDPAGTVYTKQ
jgi:hypothetical protein